MQGNRPSGVLLLLVAAALVHRATTTTVAGTYSSRVVISHDTASASARRLEGEMAPGLSWAAGVLRDGIGESALNKGKQVCVKTCAAQGASYTRPCTYEEKCRQQPQSAKADRSIN